MPSKASSRSTSLKKSQSKASLASTNSSITSDDRRSKGNKGKRRDRRVEDSSGPSQLSVEEISEEVVDYDGPRPDEEFLQAVRIELQESAHSVRRAEESIPFAYALQLSGKGQRLQKEEPIALERLVAVDWWAGGIV
eukprot:symbB.v1.2.031938.t1/scaffold3765.1/size50745/4